MPNKGTLPTLHLPIFYSSPFSQMPEEEAFCVFVRLMQEYRLRELFKPSMAELGLCIYQFEYLLQVQTRQSSLSTNTGLAVKYSSTVGQQIIHLCLQHNTSYLLIHVTALQ